MWKAKVYVLLLIVLCLPLQAQDQYGKRSKWQEGKVTDIKAAPFTSPDAGTLSGKAGKGETGRASTAKDATGQAPWTYIIETETHIYEARQTPKDKPGKVNLKVNNPVKFAVKKD